VGAAVAACSLAFGAAGSTAASKGKSKSKTINVTCKLTMTVQVPPGADSVTAPEPNGAEYGTAACGKPLGGGVYADGFTLQDTGDLTGSFKQYAGLGSVRGTYDIAQTSSSGPPTAYSFGNGDYSGTLKIKGGSGIFANAKGKGTLVCSTVDSIHYACVEKFKFSAL